MHNLNPTCLCVPQYSASPYAGTCRRHRYCNYSHQCRWLYTPATHTCPGTYNSAHYQPSCIKNMPTTFSLCANYNKRKKLYLIFRWNRRKELATEVKVSYQHESSKLTSPIFLPASMQLFISMAYKFGARQYSPVIKMYHHWQVYHKTATIFIHVYWKKGNILWNMLWNTEIRLGGNVWKSNTQLFRNKKCQKICNFFIIV